MGVRLRIERLLQQTPDLNDRKQILNAYAMLTGSDEKSMGMKFKFFSIFPKTLQSIMNTRGGFPGSHFNFRLIINVVMFNLAGFWPMLDEDAEDEKVEIESEEN
jgi:hypothetical protein